jgi:hypothetical protein
LLNEKKPNVSFFWVFGCKCYIYKKRQHLEKFQRRCDIGFLVGYSSKSKAYRVFNHATKKLNGEIFICQVYVDDIIFGSTNEDYCKEFDELMSKEFEMSMIERRDFYLSRKVHQGFSQEVQNR